MSDKVCDFDYLDLVLGTGLEPARLSAHAPQTAGERDLSPL